MGSENLLLALMIAGEISDVPIGCDRRPFAASGMPSGVSAGNESERLHEMEHPCP